MAIRSVIIVGPRVADHDTLTRALEVGGWSASFQDQAASAVTHLLARGGEAIVVSLRLSAMAELAHVYRAREVVTSCPLHLVVTCSPAERDTLQNYLSGVQVDAWLDEPYDAPALSAVLPAAPTRERLTVESLHAHQATLVRQNYFDRLGLGREADSNAVRAAYDAEIARLEALEITGDPEDGRRVLRAITTSLGEALATLRHPARRAAYVARLDGPVRPSGIQPSAAPRVGRPEPARPDRPAPTQTVSAPTAEPTTATSRRRRKAPASPEVVGGRRRRTPPPPESVGSKTAAPKEETAAHPKVSHETPESGGSPAPRDSAHGADDLLSELRAGSTAGETVAPGSFDSILEDVAERHERAPARRAPDKRLAQGGLDALFSAAVGAVGTSAPIAPSPGVAARETVSTPVSRTEPAPAPPTALPSPAPATPEPEQVMPTITPPSVVPDTPKVVADTAPPPRESAPEPKATDDSGLAVAAGSSPFATADETSDALPDFGDLEGIFDLDEDEAAAIVDAALAGDEPVVVSPTSSVAPPSATSDRNDDDRPLSVAQMAARAIDRQREEAVEQPDFQVDEPSAPGKDYDRQAPKDALAPDARTLDYSARMHAAMGDFDKAKKLLNQARAKAPSRRLDYRLALIVAQERIAGGDRPGAIELLEAAIEQHKEHEEADALLETLGSRRPRRRGLFGREDG